MARIKIQNIGPIVDVEMELNKVNVIMGPQSSGKSTIAKMISYCQWAEKQLQLYGMWGFSPDDLIKFHRFDSNYFNKNSILEYESDFAGYFCFEREEMNWTEDNNKKEIKNYLNYKKTKNIYIPSERNFVSVIPNMKKYNETNDNVLSFIYDWFSAKRIYTKKEPLSILNFDVKYYYNEGSDIDMLILKDGKEIELRTASSGLQSIVPLFVIVEYLTNNIFKGKPPVSVMARDALDRLIEAESGRKTEAEIKTLIDNRTYYHGTNFIIEEPEQNLFPTTQRDLIYDIFKRLDSEKEHSLLLTTHSPYILYAINNCMLGGLVNLQLEDAEKEAFLSESFLSQKSWINPQLVSVWEIENGQIRNIQDKDNIISKNYFDAKMTELMNEYDQILNYYKDEDER